MAAVEPPVVQQTVLEKISSFLKDPAYLEMLESAASYNSRLGAERSLRLPFVDNHTGVAQTHSDLWKSSRQRMPGQLQGQVYTYPCRRWCKRRRQYLLVGNSGRRADRDDGDSNTGDNPLLNEDSKDSSGLKDEGGKVHEQWYYEDEMMEMDPYEDGDGDSDYDYDDNYRSGRKKKRSTKGVARAKSSRPANSPKGEPETPASGGRGGRGRKRALLYDMDNDKPFACELCSARYKTRPGLTYHYTHTHKETKECDVPTTESSRDEATPRTGTPPPDPCGAPGGNNRRSRQTGSSAAPLPAPPPPLPAPAPPKEPLKDEKPATPPPVTKLPDTPEMDPYKRMALSDDKARVAASPYCDFCLGDSAENRKTSTPEELVSCSDCGRSGHPSCLQFTPNMIVSVRKYRWQCIECKCCSICGTSDNDDQLLFCDDCDRGYHMYCLAPPLTTPPEGSWSCGLCLVEFHRGRPK